VFIEFVENFDKFFVVHSGARPAVLLVRWFSLLFGWSRDIASQIVVYLLVSFFYFDVAFSINFVSL
jgi:hypothetical protein